MARFELRIKREAENSFNNIWELREYGQKISEFFECRYHENNYAILDDVIGVRFVEQNKAHIKPVVMKSKGNTDCLVLEVPFGTHTPRNVMVVD